MSEFDDFDLGRRLRDAAGSDPDVVAAHERVQHRVVRARRRRMVAVSGAAAAVVVSIGLVAALGNETGNRVETAESGTSVSDTVPVSTDETNTTVLDSSTTSVPGEPTTTNPSTTVPPTGPPAGPTTVPSPTAVPTSAPGQLPNDSTTSTAETTPSSTASSMPDDTTTVPAPADVTQPFSSVGGSIVVRLSGGQMTLLSSSATSGYETERHSEKADDIEVRFRSADAESRIRVRLVNGQMVPEIDEQ